MEGSDGSPPQSLCMIRAAELFPKPQMEKEDTQLVVPFQELAGESVRYLGRTDDGVLALSNYRIFLLKNSTSSETSVPLGLIESAQSRDLFHLIINCKDASTVKCSFETAEQCSEWQRRIQLSVGVPETLESLFAFPFCSWTCDGMANGSAGAGSGVAANGSNVFFNSENPLSISPNDYSERLQRASRYEDDFMREVERLGFDLNGSWRISHANEDFKLCPSYPRKILVPCCVSDETLQTVANFRGSRRLPAVVWRHKKSGAVIARCSQPEVGWLGWRSSKDEQLLKALADACAFDRGEQMRRMSQAAFGMTNPSGENSPSSPDGSHEEVALDEVRKVLIVDARSYTSAVTNRARGGGCECIEYYPCAEIEFMNLGNIHVIRKSFQALRQLCASPPDVPNWLGMLEKTMWLQHLSGLLAASVTVCHAIEKKGRPVLVHCSDGWDRTPQIVATAQLCLDPYYRTVEGFRTLVEREWLSYGHKFADRCGHGPGSDESNERCPVFLQWLDLVHQIHKQFPCSFEFSMGYLIKLAQHSHSCLFGTFLCNTLRERIENSVFERTFSVWAFLSGPIYRNPLYVANREKVLWPAHNLRDLSLWTEVYLGSLGNQNSADFPPCNSDGLQGSISPMAKTRSYGDLITAGIIQNGISRRSSDPNMTVDPNLTIGSNSENNSIADMHSEREDSPDFIANLIHDTTRIQNLTIELNNHDDENYKNLQKPFAHRTFENGSETSSGLGDNFDRENTSSTVEKLLQHQQYQQQQQNSSTSPEYIESNSIGPATFYSSPLNLNEIGCEINSTSALTSVACAISSSSSLPASTASVDETQSSFNGFLNTCNDIVEARDGNKTLPKSEITVQTTNDMKLDLMHSVDLGETSTNALTSFNDSTTTNNGIFTNTDDYQSPWHGSVNTSTDTLVPIESKQPTASQMYHNEKDRDGGEKDEIDGISSYIEGSAKGSFNDSLLDYSKDSRKTLTGNNHLPSTSCSILPKVHSRSNILAPSVAVSSPSMSSLNDLNTNLNTYNNNNNDCSKAYQNNVDAGCDDSNSIKLNPMEESIIILPEHQKLEISVSGKCETVVNNIASGTNETPTMVATAVPNSFASTQRRRRTSSSNSRRECFNTKPTTGSTISKFSIPGVRSLPLTPPGLPERSQIAISCPDGLAHALSEQNIRLQQIVHEHKLREDVLLREIHDMRMALLKRTCPNCNNTTATNEDQVDEFLNEVDHRLFELCYCCSLCATCKKTTKRRHRPRHPRGLNADNDDEEGVVYFGSSSTSACSALDNVENASICSWEAVEDRSGPSSCTSSSIQPNAASVLWVPDHAVSRCTSCQTEFWLGRRKHHCRSCGQIFCADCSEFWAPLPDEKLFTPVRLCGPCYHSVTTRMQFPQQLKRYNRNTLIAASNSTSSSSSSSSKMASVAAAPANALTLKTLSALALQQKARAQSNEMSSSTKMKDRGKTGTLTQNVSDESSSRLGGSNMPMLMSTNNTNRSAAANRKPAMANTNVVAASNAATFKACCNHTAAAAAVALQCQEQHSAMTTTAAMKAATTAASN